MVKIRFKVEDKILDVIESFDFKQGVGVLFGFNYHFQL